jgi:hypothetical protein
MMHVDVLLHFPNIWLMSGDEVASPLLQLHVLPYSLLTKRAPVTHLAEHLADLW